jgi:hypothetical protein
MIYCSGDCLATGTLFTRIPMRWPLHERLLQPELMDEPDMAGQRHVDALRGLERINVWSGSAGILWPTLVQLARSNAEAIRILDVATGGGDLPIRLWHCAKRVGLQMEIEGMDRSASAIEHARRSAAARKADVRFFVGDALGEELPRGYDAIMCSLFLHHRSRDDAVLLLHRMGEAALRAVLVNDLRRSVVGLLLAYGGTRLLSRSRVVHVDGPLSVRAAFTVAEARSLAVDAGLKDIVIVRRWPCRFLLTARGPQ